MPPLAIADLANDLRLRQIDLLGVQYGAEVALALAAARPELVRRLVLVGGPAADRSPPVKQQRLMVDIKDLWGRSLRRRRPDPGAANRRVLVQSALSFS